MQKNKKVMLRKKKTGTHGCSGYSDKGRNNDSNQDKDKDRGRDKDKDRGRDKDKDRGRDKEKNRGRDKDKETIKDKDKEEVKERSRDRDLKTQSLILLSYTRSSFDSSVPQRSFHSSIGSYQWCVSASPVSSILTHICFVV